MSGVLTFLLIMCAFSWWQHSKALKAEIKTLDALAEEYKGIAVANAEAVEVAEAQAKQRLAGCFEEATRQKKRADDAAKLFADLDREKPRVSVEEVNALCNVGAPGTGDAVVKALTSLNSRHE